VAPAGDFLTEPHTLKRYRNEFWRPAVCDRNGLKAWMTGGRHDAVYRAGLRCQQLLARHEDPPLDGSTARHLQSFVDKAQS
jgi:trimethylamine--corrinoid protein Co-methyltransferase